MKTWQARIIGMSWTEAARYAGYADAATANRGVRTFFGQLPQIETDEYRDQVEPEPELWEDVCRQCGFRGV